MLNQDIQVDVEGDEEIGHVWLARQAEKSRTASDSLLASLFVNHPDHALLALKGVKPAKVIDLDPPAAPQVVPIPTKPNMEASLRHRPPKIELIICEVAAFYECSTVDLVSQRREHFIIKPRHVAMYLAKEMTAHPYTVIGKRFGDRDHTSAMHARHKIAQQVDTDDRIRDEIDVLKLRIMGAMLNPGERGDISDNGQTPAPGAPHMVGPPS